MKKSLLLSALLLATACNQPMDHAYHLAKTVPVEGAGGWDYVRVDSEGRRVYVAHTTKVDVLDADSGAVVGSVGPIAGAHGVAIADQEGYGFATNGKANKVTVFDLKTLALVSEISTDKKPDAIMYDHPTKRVFAFNGDSGTATVIDAVRLKKIGTVVLGGAPEFAISDKEGRIFVNLEDKSEMLAIDAKAMNVVERWQLAPCEEPASIAMDRDNHRLFAGCGNRMLAVVDAKNGHVITTLPIGEHVDATAFDPATHEIISSAADGTLTIIKQDDADHYHVAQTVKTPLRSKTFGLDKETHRLFVPVADFGAAAPPSVDNPKGRPQPIDGTFKVLIFDRNP